MKTLAGKFEHVIDPKGRFIMPAKLREGLGDSFTVTIGLDGCLYIYSDEGWEKFTQELATLPGKADDRRLKRAFMENAACCDIDKQGRVLIPETLRKKVGIDKEIILIGMIDKVELWSRERHEAQSNNEPIEDIVENLTEYIHF